MGIYNREKAVEYANKWWNDNNPKFVYFEEDCTNFISQCLWAGGSPMSYVGEHEWWYRKKRNSDDDWSRSWAVADSLRHFLLHNKKGLTTTEVENPWDLEIGDIICYDFDGDGEWQHNTIVTAKDMNGMPYVNAHTFSAKEIFWAMPYWRPTIQYTFLHVNDKFKD